MNELKLKKQGFKEMLVGTTATAIIIVILSIYGLTETQRIESSKKKQLLVDLDVAMGIYAENCSICHGIAGEGIGAIPGLDKTALKESDPTALTKIISRGLFKTQMPAWSKKDGGPLSEYQIEQMVTLIRFGDWKATKDKVINLGLAPKIPFSAEADQKILEELKKVTGGEILVKGINLFASKCVACHGGDGLGTDLAPAINDQKVRSKPSEEVKRIISLGVPGTLMAGWDNSLSNDELISLITLINKWDKVPSGAVPVVETPIPVTKESIVLGTSLYSGNCASCHGPEGQGRGRHVPPLNVKGFLNKTNDRAIEQIITLGKPDTPMPAWGDRMTKAEIQAIVGFVRSWESTAPEMAEPVRGRGSWWQTGEKNNLSSGGGNWSERNQGNRGEQGRGQGRGRGKGKGQGQGKGKGQGRNGQNQNSSEGPQLDKGVGQGKGGGNSPRNIAPQTSRSIIKVLGWKEISLSAGIFVIALVMIGIGIWGYKKNAA